MKVNCDKCQSGFNIDPNRIPPKGLTIRCPKCLNSFFVPSAAGAGQEAVPTTSGTAAGESQAPKPEADARPSQAETRAVAPFVEALVAGETAGTDLPKDVPSKSQTSSGLIDMLLGTGDAFAFENTEALPPLPVLPELPKLPDGAELPNLPKLPDIPVQASPKVGETRQLDMHPEQPAADKPKDGSEMTLSFEQPPSQGPDKDRDKDQDKGSGLDYGMLDMPGADNTKAIATDEDSTKALLADAEKLMQQTQPKESGISRGRRMKIRRRSGKVFGPFDTDTIIRMIVEHKLLGNEEMSEDGVGWTPIGQVQEFSAAIKHVMDQAGPEGIIPPTLTSKEVPAAAKKGRSTFAFISELPFWAVPAVAAALLLAACLLPVPFDQGVFGYKYFLRMFKGGVTNQERQVQNFAAAALENDVYGDMNQSVTQLKGAMKSSMDKDRTGGLLARTWLLFLQRYGLDQAQAGELKKLIEDLDGTNSSQPDALLARTVYYSLAGDSEARAKTRGKLDDYPDLAAYSDAVLALSEKNNEKAEKFIASFLKDRPKSILALHTMGVLVLGRDDTKAASEYFKKALDLNSAHLTSKAELVGITLSTGGDREEAIKDLQSIIAKGKDIHPKEMARVRFLLGRAFMSKKMAAEAEEQLSQAVKQDPENNLYRNTLGLLYLDNVELDKALNDFSIVLQRDPQDVTASLGLIRVLIEKRNIIESLNRITRLAGVAATNPEVLFYKGRVEEELEKYNDAIATYRGALGVKKDYLQPRLAIAGILIKQGKDKEAIAELDEAMKTSPGSKEVHNSKGEVLVRMARLDEAIQEFTAAVAVDKYFTDARFNLAVAQVNKGDCQQALSNMDIVVAQVGKYPMGRYWLGRACMCLKDYKRSVAEFEDALKASPSDPLVLAMAGRAYSEKGDYPRALELLQTALVYDKSMAEAHYQLGMTFRRMKEVEKAIEEFRQAAERGKNNAQYRFMLGQALIRGNLLGEAVDELKVASELEPGWAKIYYQMGRAYRLQRMCKLAIPAFQKAYSLDPARIKAQYMVGRCQFDMGDYKGAERTLLATIRSSTDFARSHYLLGRVYQKVGKTSEAFAEFNKVVKMDSKNPMPHYYLGFMYKERNNQKEAAYHFGQYLKIAPNGPYAKDIREELEFIKQNREIGSGKGVIEGAE